MSQSNHIKTVTLKGGWRDGTVTEVRSDTILYDSPYRPYTSDGVTQSNGGRYMVEVYKVSKEDSSIYEYIECVPLKGFYRGRYE